MDKRITLNKLIQYIQTNVELPNNKEVEKKNLITTNHNPDDFKFAILGYKERKTIVDFPKKLKEIFDPFTKDLQRIGVLRKFQNKEKNISLIFSTLLCILDNFGELDEASQQKYIEEVRKKLVNEVLDEGYFMKKGYKELNWKKTELKNSINEFRNNKMMLRVLSDYFNLNIFLLNIAEDRIYAIYSEDNFNIFKMNMFLVFSDDQFEPLFYTNCKLWKFDLEPFKKLINVDKQKINILDVDFSEKLDKPDEQKEKTFQIGTEELEKYLDLSKKIVNEENSTQTGPNTQNTQNAQTAPDVQTLESAQSVKAKSKENDFDEVFENVDHKTENECTENMTENIADNMNSNNEKDIFCTLSSKSSKSSKANVQIDLKMKLDDLQKIAKKYNIKLEQDGANGKSKKKTKKELYDELKKHLSIA